MAGARVTLTFFGPRDWEATATTNGEGAFEIRRVSPGLYHLAAERKGFAPLLVSEVEVPERPDRTDLGTLAMTAGATVEGIVVDERGAPLEGARVLLNLPVSLRREGEEEFETTGPDGVFRFVDLLPGQRTGVRVELHGYAAAMVPEVPVPTSEPVRIELRRGKILEGRVVGPAGRPLSGASIRVEERTPQFAISRPGGETDEAGAFRVEDLLPGMVTLYAVAPGYLERRTEARVPEDGPAERLEIALAQAAVLEGRVLDAQERPVAGVIVSAEIEAAPDAAGDGPQLTGADAEGRFLFESLPPGTYRVRAIDPGRGAAEARAILPPGPSRLDLAFKGGAEVAGQVLDDDGAPVPGALLVLVPVRAEGQTAPPLRATAAATGAFLFPSVPDGIYSLHAGAEGFADAVAPDPVTVEGSPVPGLELRLSRGATLTGRLLGLEPGEARSARIFANSPRDARSGMAGSDGAFRLRGLGAGTWKVMATTGSRTAAATVEILPGQAAASVDLAFDPEPPPP